MADKTKGTEKAGSAPPPLPLMDQIAQRFAAIEDQASPNSPRQFLKSLQDWDTATNVAVNELVGQIGPGELSDALQQFRALHMAVAETVRKLA